MRHVFATAVVLLTASLAWAESPQLIRFAQPLSISAVNVRRARCVTGDWDEEACLDAALAVVHRDARGRVLHDAATYPVDGQLGERLAADFGEHAALALREVGGAMQQAGLLEEPGLHGAARRCLLHVARFVHYELLPAVGLSIPLEREVSRLADRFHELARRGFVITSGPRTPESQAAAMYLKIVMRTSLRRLYRNTEAAEEIRRSYQRAAGARQRRTQIIAAMANVIRRQMRGDVYISPHLRGGAVDVRTRDMNPSAKVWFQRVVAEFSHMRLIREEKIPPHYHLEITTLSEAGRPAPASAPASVPVRPAAHTPSPPPAPRGS